MDNKLLKSNIKKYLESKTHPGGLYGLTIRDEDFIPGLMKIIKLSSDNKEWNLPKKDKEKHFDLFK